VRCISLSGAVMIPYGRRRISCSDAGELSYTLLKMLMAHLAFGDLFALTFLFLLTGGRGRSEKLDSVARSRQTRQRAQTFISKSKFPSRFRIGRGDFRVGETVIVGTETATHVLGNGSRTRHTTRLRDTRATRRDTRRRNNISLSRVTYR